MAISRNATLILSEMRSIGRFLQGDKDVVENLWKAQTGEEPADGDSLLFEVDLQFIGERLAQYANWTEAIATILDTYSQYEIAADSAIQVGKKMLAEAEDALAPTKRSRVRGGRQSGLVRAKASQEVKERAIRLIQEYKAAGHPDRDIASKVAKRVGKSASWVRVVRREAKIK